MANPVEFGILGPLAVASGGQTIVVSGLRAQRALAALVVHAGQLVSIDLLVEYVWDDPPPTARQQIHTLVYRLRRQIGAALATTGGGYRLDPAGARIDVAEFDAAVRRGRALAADDDRPGAARELRAALGLWRGRPLEGLPGERFATHATRLEEQRLAVLEECAEAELGLGRHRALIPELQALAAEHPLRERAAALLITALSRDGRQADAIRHYHAVVATLRDELGVEPGPRLRETYVEALREAERPESTAAAQGRLPRAPRRLVGRDGELRRLLDAARDATRLRPAVVVVDGMAGVGKSALALTAAHALAAEFPDVHLHIDLQGHSQRAPVAPHDALGVLLRRLGRRAPDDPDERAEAWREHLRGRRAVLVLDNAGGAAQVEPLLPHGSPSVVLVTSRTRLGPIDGAAGLSLEPLDPAAGVELLRDTTDERVDADPEGASDVVRRCGGLPLAIRLVGHRLQHRPRWTIGMLSDQLASAELAPLDVSAEKQSVAAAFEVSYRQLTEPDRRLFRRLGLHPAGTSAAEAAAALAGVEPDEAGRRLEDLVEVNLVQADTPGRYRLHDLLRAYSASLVGDDERRPALDRMFAHYQAALDHAGRHLEIVGVDEPGTTDGAAWVVEHWATIVALTELAAQVGANREAVALARLAWPSARVFGYCADALRMLEWVHPIVDSLGDDLLAAMTERNLAGIYLHLGRFAACRASLRRAEEIYRRLGEDRLVREVEVNRITLLRMEGRQAEAVELAGRVEAATGAAGEHRSRQLALAAGGAAAFELGLIEPAGEMFDRIVQAGLDNKAANFSIALDWLGRVEAARDHPAAAGLLLVWSIHLKQRHGNLGGAAEALAAYGKLMARQGHHAEGLRLARAAHEQVLRIGDGHFETSVANDLGEVLTMLGLAEEAAATHEGVLRRADVRPYERSRAEAGLAAARTVLARAADNDSGPRH
ncbi:AfsR/SARP family transcriptional regulator [Dactylosporangium salmoneum]|uniref:BTAD domain-containing putative transcriptional regulator n=1 Tax=Dactylosporangium salmoneum TaxID=53361 RepID=A0ABN3G2H0_9ACTN